MHRDHYHMSYTHHTCTHTHTHTTPTPLTHTALVGQLGTVELAAVGLGSVFYIFLVFCFSTFQVTTTSLVGAETARNNRTGVRDGGALGAWVVGIHYFVNVLMHVLVVCMHVVVICVYVVVICMYVVVILMHVCFESCCTACRSCTHMHTPIISLPNTGIHPLIYKHRHTPSHIQTPAYTLSYTNTGIHPLIYKHRHTPSHIQTPAYTLSYTGCCTVCKVTVDVTRNGGVPVNAHGTGGPLACCMYGVVV